MIKEMVQGFLLTAMAAVMLVSTVGCSLGPKSLNDSVLGYDETTADLELKLLLLNIARRDHGQPIHFTVASSIAATYDWSSNAGIGGDTEQAAEDFWKNTLNLNLGVSSSENPTFSIYPVTGEEFTQRLLTPITEDLFNTVTFQDPQIDEVIRLLASGIELYNEDGSFNRLIANDPSRPEEYIEFRQIVMHLQWLYDQRQLFIRSLVYEEPLLENFPDYPSPSDITDAVSTGLSWKKREKGTFDLVRLRSGRLVVTNYDPNSLSDQQKSGLHNTIKYKPSAYVHLDIEPDGPGGDFPIYGAIKLRSMIQILDFVAAGISRAPEFDVVKDSRTGFVADNPPSTLEIIKSDTRPPDTSTAVYYRGDFYHVADTDWDRANFRIISWLFQASVGDIESPGIPITIAK